MTPQALRDILLKNRNVADTEQFLSPSYERLSDPYLMHDMERAVVRVFEAMEAKEKIVIYSDYDCDGIPGGVLCVEFFKKIGYENVSNYIPHRHDEGYGLHKDAIDTFIKDGVSLIITIDLGITAVDEVAHAAVSGIDIIITDHHEPLAVLPKAYAIVNPKLGSYPDPMLCGAGTIFRLVQAFLQKYGEYYKVPVGWEKWLLDMVGIATLSDMVPLVHENRILAHFGLQVLRKTRRPGLIALARLMNMDLRYLVEEDVTFMIAPRLNAASRMASPELAFSVLAESDPVQAKATAETLSKINDERKYEVARIMKEVHQTLAKRESSPVIVIGNPEWRVGVLGLVAGKLVESHGCPVFVWGGHDEDCYKGSCRAEGSASVVEMMSGLSDGALLQFGGHEQAGGFSVSTTEIHFLEERLLAVYEKVKRGVSEKQKSYTIDTPLLLEDISRNLFDTIDTLAPFGVGNPKPTFLFEKVEVISLKQFGKTKEHLEIIVGGQNGKKVKAIAFFANETSYDCPIVIGEKINLVGTLELSRFAGKVELRLRIVDVI